MPAGELRERIEIKAKSVTRDASGAEVVTYVPFAKVWASVAAIGGSETIDQQQAAAVVNYTIGLRYYPGVLPTMIVVWRGHTLVITAPPIDDLKRGLMTLTCSEQVVA